MAIAHTITPNRRHHATLESPDERFAPYWLLVGIAGAAVFALWLLYPRTYIEHALKVQGRPNVATLAYLQLLVRGKPDDTQVRLLLAQQALDADQIALARYALAPWQHQPWLAMPMDTMRLRLRLMQQELASLPDDSSHRATLKVDYVRAIQRLAPRMTPAQLLDQARFALALGAFRSVADLDRQVLARSHDAARRQEAFAQGIAALLAAGRTNEALDFARAALPHVKHDDALWHKMIHLALAAGRPDLATGYARRMVGLQGTP